MITVQANGETLHTALEVRKGITAFVGGGGKTTAMLCLARALSMFSSVLVTTSTHIYPPENMPVLYAPTVSDIREAQTRQNPICIGTPEASGKLTRPLLPFVQLRTLFDYVLVEADGAKGMPLKAPAAHEPVLPENVDLVIAVAGLDGIGRTIQDVAFRSAQYAEVLEENELHCITPEDAASVLTDVKGQYKCVCPPTRFAVLLNKADDPSRIMLARRVVSALDETRVERAVIASCKETKPV